MASQEPIEPFPSTSNFCHLADCTALEEARKGTRLFIRYNQRDDAVEPVLNRLKVTWNIDTTPALATN